MPGPNGGSFPFEQPPLPDEMEASENPNSTAPWNRLWKDGVLHSCSQGISGNYDQEILDFWRRQFMRLADGETMVDVGTGNGAIPLLALSSARARGIRLDIHGVDLADIDPPGNVPGGPQRYDGIRFHPNTSMTSLPFADGEVALLCSQFAFEYAPREQAASEVLRVIGQRGRAALIVHSADSIIATTGDAQLRASRWLLHESDLLQATFDLLKAMAGATSTESRAALASDPVAESARLAFNRSATALMEQIEGNTSAQILQHAAQRISQLLKQPTDSREDAYAHVSGLREWIEDEQTRLLLMREAVLDPTALQECAGLLGRSDLPVHTDRLLYEGSVCMGWTITVGHE